MANFIAIVILGLILGFAIGYIVKSKKKGAKCIGCPYAGECHPKSGGKSCTCQDDSNK